MNLHTLPRTFYIARHGQSEYNQHGKIGGDSGLTKSGVEFARRLNQFAKDNIMTETVLCNNDDSTILEKRTVPARLWTSTLRRTKETAQFFEHPTIKHTLENGETIDWVQMRHMHRRNLDEIFAGSMDGMTYKEIEEQFPEEFKRRQKDKLAYRYPRGESYMDVMLRLEPMACEMERTREPILIIGHQGIHRILYAYFMGLSRHEAPFVNIPLNTVIKLTPYAYTCDEERICLMDKEEMMLFSDGQDEPVTSMPRRISSNTTSSQQQQQTTEETTSTNNKSHTKTYSFDDVIMNAPSH
jgi:broad specificity phosphatase PhoE